MLVPRVPLEHQPDPAALDQAAVPLAHDRRVGLGSSAGMLDQGDVDAQIADGLDPPGELGVDQVALDDAGDVGHARLRARRRDRREHDEHRHEALHVTMIR